MKSLPSLLILSAMLTAALGLPMTLIGCEKKSPLPGEATQDPAPRIEPSDDGAALLKRKMAGITIPEIAMNNASLAEALDFLHKSSIPQDAADSGKGGNGIDFVLLKSALSDSREPLLNELKKAVREQEDKVEERRKILGIIERMKEIIYREDSSFGGEGRLDEDQHATTILLNIKKQIEAKKIEIQSQIDGLLKYKDEKLLIYAAFPDLPDNIIKDLEEGVVDLRTRLEGQLELAKERLAKVEIKKTETKPEAMERNVHNLDYINVKSDLETDLALQDNMKLRIINEEITARLEIPHRVTLNLRQAPFEDALKNIVQQCGLSYAIHSSSIVVGTADEIAALDGRSR